MQAVTTIAPADAGMANLFAESPDMAELPLEVVGIPAVAAERPADPPGLMAWSGVEAMRNRLQLLQAPIYGTKDQLWGRLQQYEGFAKKEHAMQSQGGSKNLTERL